ncbi:MAG: M61 family metallopeptidase [Bacteroidia bacterium]
MKRLTLLTILLITATLMQGEVIYKVSFPKPETHYVQIEMELSNPSGTFTDFVMPVWTPGSYKVREFSRNVSVFAAFENLKIEKQNKNTWRVHFKNGVKKIKISYQVYTFEYGVRTSYLDVFQAFLHGGSVFMYANGYQQHQCRIVIDKPNDWKHITVALPALASNTFMADNYDLLADSPFALGNHDIIYFEVAGVKHRVAMLGEGNYDAEKIKTDFKKIIEKEVAMMGDHPSPEYVVFIQNVESGGGGLEHLNSQTSVIQRWAYSNETKYKSFLSLIAHEYFHLWNVKRIRPIELGPFDYTKENYTKMLWVVEGITSYYDDLFIKRCDIYKEEEYLNIVATAINKMENLPGGKVQSLAESSFDAWIKFYWPDENSDNATISYYQKGMLAAMVVDLEIIKRTNGKKKLDDVMRYLYTEYYKTKKRGFTEEEFAKALETIAGSSFKDLLNEVIYTTNAIPFGNYLAYVGLELKNQSSTKMPLGINTKLENGKTMVKFVEVNRPASKAGLSVNDEIIAINGYRVNGDIDEFTSRFKEGVEVEMVVSRTGKLITLKIKPEKDPTVNYKVIKIEKPSEEQKVLFDFWIK